MLTLFCVDIRDIFEYIQIKVKKNYFYSIGVQLNNNVPKLHVKMVNRHAFRLY